MLRKLIQNLARSQRGATALEYVFLATLLTIGLLASVISIGNSLNNRSFHISNTLNAD
jgi:Flp pilus assembly pilin Flp